MRGLAQELRVAVEEVLVHADLHTVRHHPVAVGVEGLDAAEDVVPAAAVERDDVIAQLVEDLIHLEGGPQRLDQHGGLDGLLRNLQRLLGIDEDRVPEPRFEMALHLRQIEVRAGAALDQLLRVVEKVKREVDDATRCRLAVDEDVLLLQMPAARAHDERGGLRIELVLLALGRGVADLLPHRVVHAHLAFHHQAPGRAGGILEVGHEALGPRVQRVDDHLALDRAGDLDAAVEQILRDAGDLPLAVANLLRFFQEAWLLAGVDGLLALDAQGEELLTGRRVLADESGDELDRLRREDFLGGRGHAPGDLDALDRAHRQPAPGRLDSKGSRL